MAEIMYDNKKSYGKIGLKTGIIANDGREICTGDVIEHIKFPDETFAGYDSKRKCFAIMGAWNVPTHKLGKGKIWEFNIVTSYKQLHDGYKYEPNGYTVVGKIGIVDDYEIEE